MRLTTKHFLLKNSTVAVHYVYYGDNTVSIPGGLPAWITATDETDDEGRDRIKLEFDPVAVGSYGPYDFGDFNIEAEVVTALYASVDGCCDSGEVNIAWFNRLSGWQNWKFRRRRTFELQSKGDAKQFSRDLTAYYSKLPDKFEGEVVSVTIHSQSQLDNLSTLKYALQAYVYNSETGEYDIPILIDQESFTKYFDKQKTFIPFSFRFIYAERLNTQTQ